MTVLPLTVLPEKRALGVAGQRPDRPAEAGMRAEAAVRAGIGQDETMTDLRPEQLGRRFGPATEWHAAGRWESAVTGALCGLRALYGAGQLAAATPLPDRRDPPTLPWLMRVIGARHLAQAAITAPRPTPAVLAVGAQVDLLHAASMVVAAAADSERRARLLSDAGVAGLLGLLGFAAYASAGGGHWETGRPRGVPARLLGLRDRVAQAVAAHTVPGARCR